MQQVNRGLPVMARSKFPVLGSAMPTLEEMRAIHRKLDEAEAEEAKAKSLRRWPVVGSVRYAWGEQDS